MGEQPAYWLRPSFLAAVEEKTRWASSAAQRSTPSIVEVARESAAKDARFFLAFPPTDKNAVRDALQGAIQERWRRADCGPKDLWELVVELAERIAAGAVDDALAKVHRDSWQPPGGPSTLGGVAV